MNEHLTTSTTHHDLINLLLQDGLGEGLPRIAELLMNAAMLIERTKHIGVGPYERVEARSGQAKGFKPRTFHTSMGGLNLATPQVRGSDTPFRTSLLAKGSRNDSVPNAAISSMYLWASAPSWANSVVSMSPAPKLASWVEQNIPERLTAFSFPEASRQRLRTSNMCEMLNSQIKRRTRVVGLFPDESSLLRLATGVLVEISEE